MYRIAICDDDAYELTKTKKYIEEVLKERGDEGVVIVTFGSSVEFLSYLSRFQSAKRTEKIFDIVFSDVVMPEKNGIELGQAIREMEMDVPIIYTSSFRDYAFDSYGVRAFDYLLKPIDKKRLAEVIDRVFASIETRKGIEISVRTKEGVRTVPLKQIVYIEYAARCIEYHLSDGTVLVTIYNRGKFEDALEPLSQQKNFIQTHKSYFVNLDFVHELRTNDLLLENDMVIPISRNQKQLVKDRYLEYFTGWSQ